MTERDDWFFTYTGRRLFVLSPDPEQIVIEDIAHHLSLLCRFVGAVRTFYSVAQHSVLVSRHVPWELQMSALLHDATEAYLGDVIRPVKRQLPEYKELERVWAAAIEHRFDVRTRTAEIEEADHRALITERRDLCAHSPDHPWAEDKMGYEPFRKKILPLKDEQAESLFLARWGEVS